MNKNSLIQAVEKIGIKKTEKRRTTMKSALKHKIKAGLWTALVATVCIFVKAPAHAATPSASLDIHVSINASKSLTLGTTSYDFGALAVNTSSVSAAAIVVTNDSGSLQETYTLQGANATGGSGWTLNTTTGTADNYVLGGMFSTAQPTNDPATWSSSLMTTSAVACSATQFGNGTAAESGLNVSPLTASKNRNFWLRMITPLYVTDTVQKNITITLAVQ
jgi:hypothetical protein